MHNAGGRDILMDYPYSIGELENRTLSHIYDVTLKVGFRLQLLGQQQ
jgi:hypothetical protein